MRALFAILILLASVMAPRAVCAAPAEPAPALKPGDVLACIGDSITNQRLYTLFIEDYLLMCKPVPDVRMVTLGTNGQTATGFLRDESAAALEFHPTVATVMFGMNDGGYAPLTSERAAEYAASERGVVERLRGAGVRTVVLASPSCVDTYTYKEGKQAAELYNQALARLADEARDAAADTGARFADVHAEFAAAMARAKGIYGEQLDVAGADGIHPGNNGQLVIAYTLLKSLGFDGDLGTISVNLADNSASATGGHRIVSAQSGVIEIESSRYPFCFMGLPTESSGTVAVPGYIPFNQDLNRLTLVVKHAGTGKLKVTWGDTSKAFDGAALEKGINLAAEFTNGPFNEQFFKVEKEIRQKESDEEHWYHTDMEAGPAAVEKVLGEERERAAAVAELVTPVRHRIVIERE